MVESTRPDGEVTNIGSFDHEEGLRGSFMFASACVATMDLEDLVDLELTIVRVGEFQISGEENNSLTIKDLRSESSM